MTLKSALKTMGYTILIATVFQTLIISGISWITGADSTMYNRDLYQLPLTALLSSLPSLVFVRPIGKELGRWEFIIRNFLHFALTGGIVFTALVFFGWIRTGNVIMPVVGFLIIYAIFLIGNEIRARDLARKLNKKLNEESHS